MQTVPVKPGADFLCDVLSELLTFERKQEVKFDRSPRALTVFTAARHAGARAAANTSSGRANVFYKWRSEMNSKSTINNLPIIVETMWMEQEYYKMTDYICLDDEWAEIVQDMAQTHEPLAPNMILVEARPKSFGQDLPPAPTEPQGLSEPFHETARVVISCLPAHLASCLDVQCSLSLKDDGLETWGVVPSPIKRHQDILNVISSDEGANCLSDAGEHLRQCLSGQMRGWMTKQGVSEVVINGCIRLS